MSGLESDSDSDSDVSWLDWQGCQKQQLESIVILSTLNVLSFQVKLSSYAFCTSLYRLYLQACHHCKTVLLVCRVGGND